MQPFGITPILLDASAHTVIPKNCVALIIQKRSIRVGTYRAYIGKMTATKQHTDTALCEMSSKNLSQK
jgi:hypothetical protein